MPRGAVQPIGTERKAANGYWYVKVAKGDGTAWKLKHHLVAEKTLGRPLQQEQARFKDGNIENFSPDNIEVIPIGKASIRRRIAQLESRIKDLQGELAYYQKKLANES